MDESTRIAVIGMGAPAAIGLAVGLLALRPGLPPGAGKLSAGDMLAWLDKPVRVGLLASVAAAFAIAVGWYVSLIGTLGPTNWPPISSDDRLRLAAIVLGVAGLIGGLVIRGSRERWAGVWGAILGATGTAIVLWPQVSRGDWPTWHRIVAVCGFGLWGAIATWPLADMLGRGRRITSAVILAGLGAAVGAGLMGTGSVQLGNRGLGFAAVLVGLTIAVALRKGTAIGAAAIALAAGSLATQMSMGRYFSSAPTWVCVLLALVPLAGWIVDRLIGRRLGSFGGAALSILAAAALAAATIAPGLIALAKFAAGSDSE